MVWYHRPSTPIGPLPKIGHRYFLFPLSYSMDKKSHHTKFHQNWLKNKKVMGLPPPYCCGFVRKAEKSETQPNTLSAPLHGSFHT